MKCSCAVPEVNLSCCKLITPAAAAANTTWLHGREQLVFEDEAPPRSWRNIGVYTLFCVSFSNCSCSLLCVRSCFWSFSFSLVFVLLSCHTLNVGVNNFKQFKKLTHQQTQSYWELKRSVSPQSQLVCPRFHLKCARWNAAHKKATKVENGH